MNVALAAVAMVGLMESCSGKAEQKNEVCENKVCCVAEGVSGQVLADGSVFIWLKDNDGDKLNSRDLFSDAPDALIDSLGLSEGIPASVSTFLLKCEGKNILFDAGLGAKMGGHLAERLEAIGMNADSVDMIYLTHLHLDHIGGMMGEEGAAFAKAEVYVGKVEYDAWMNQMPEEKTGMQRAVMGMYADRLHMVEFGDTLPCGVVAMDAVGHTPGHTAFQKGEVLVIGDLMHGLALQEGHPEYNSNYDMDKQQAAASRKRVIDYARANGLLMAGMHLPAPGVAR